MSAAATTHGVNYGHLASTKRAVAGVASLSRELSDRNIPASLWSFILHFCASGCKCKK